MKLGDTVEISATGVVGGMEVDYKCGVKYMIHYVDQNGVVICYGQVPEAAIVKEERTNKEAGDDSR